MEHFKSLSDCPTYRYLVYDTLMKKWLPVSNTNLQVCKNDRNYKKFHDFLDKIEINRKVELHTTDTDYKEIFQFLSKIKVEPVQNERNSFTLSDSTVKEPHLEMKTDSFIDSLTKIKKRTNLANGKQENKNIRQMPIQHIQQTRARIRKAPPKTMSLPVGRSKKLENHKCSKCDLTCSNLKCLRQHLSVHTKKVCSLCDLQVKDSMHLKKHMLITHKNQYDRKCLFCNYVGPKNNFDAHILAIHDQIRNKVCPHCRYAAAHDVALKRHIKMVHSKIRDIYCTLCNYAATCVNDVTRHKNRVHYKIKSKMCDICPFKTDDNWHMKRHTKVHEDPPT